jgi:hypothetical protein
LNADSLSDYGGDQPPDRLRRGRGPQIPAHISITLAIAKLLRLLSWGIERQQETAYSDYKETRIADEVSKIRNAKAGVLVREW